MEALQRESDGKLNIKIDPVGSIHMESMGFSAVLYTDISRPSRRFEKDEMVRVDADNYRLPFNAADIPGTGAVLMNLTVSVTDGDFADGTMDKVLTLKTGLVKV